MKGNLCSRIKEGISLKSAVMAFIVDGGQKGRTLREICRGLNLKEKEARDILSELGFLGLIHSDAANSVERWFSLAEVA